MCRRCVQSAKLAFVLEEHERTTATANLLTDVRSISDDCVQTI